VTSQLNSPRHGPYGVVLRRLKCRAPIGYPQQIRLIPREPYLFVNSDSEEDFDRKTYEILWEMATAHPEAGLQRMSCLEYHEVPLSETGILRDGQTYVWFKDLVHDVFNQLTLLNPIVS
jgi:hypothetical protein